MNSPNRIVVLLGTLALIGGLASAAYWPLIAAWFAPPPPPPAPEKLTLAISDTYIASGLVQLAAAKGYFSAEGIEVTLQPHASGRSALDAVIGDKAEIATVGDTPVMFAVTGNVPLSVIATIGSAMGSHGIAARRDRGVSTPADLKGKTIGVTPGTDSHFMLNVILASHGIAPRDVTTQSTRPEQMTTALSAGQVDAIATWEPWLSGARNAAGANVVAFFPESGFGFSFHLAGRRKFVREHPATMQKLLRSLLRAERYLEESPLAARAIVVAATRSDPAVFDMLWPNFSLGLSLRQATLTMLEDQAQWAISSAYTKAAEVPNFLESIYLDAMLAVKPQAVSIVR